MMKPEHNAILDDLLSRWHSWMNAARLTRGYEGKAAGCGDYLISRQYDDTNGKLDADLDEIRSKAVDHEVNEMFHPHRTAIYVDARNLCTGVSVWDSPRLPKEPAERARILEEARILLCHRLMNAGVI